MQPTNTKRPEPESQTSKPVTFEHAPQFSAGLAGTSQSDSTSAPHRSPSPSVVASFTAGTVEKSRPEKTNRNQDGNIRLLFSCLKPINPLMRNRETRLQTFLDHSTTWPAHRIGATPQEIADAGMYYLGEMDCVKCWYCNGGLHNWEQDDNPWEEHVKWFPMCEFVHQQKGSDFVHQIVCRYPNLRRPILRNPVSLTQPGQMAGTPGTRSSAPSSATTRRGGDNPQIIDARKEMKNMEKIVEIEMLTSELVLLARQMGFEDKEIKEALKRNYESNNDNFSNLDSLLEAIMSITCEDYSDTDESPTFETEDPSSSENHHSPLQELKRLEESRLCRVCRKELYSIVFIPCGHLVCCTQCGQSARRCPACKHSISNTIQARFF